MAADDDASELIAQHAVEMGETPIPPAQPVEMGETPIPPAQPVEMGETPIPPAQPVASPPPHPTPIPPAQPVEMGETPIPPPQAPSPETPRASEPKAPSAARSAALVTLGILLSKLVGLVRQHVIGRYFGIGGYADALMAAFQVGNITQNLLGEGTLSASFIPVYAKLRATGKTREAKAFALSALGVLLLAAIAFSALGVAFAPWLTALIAQGFDAEKQEVVTDVARVAFPMTGLLVLSAWGLGVLNAHRRFFLSYAAPVLWSLAQIGGLLIFGGALGLRGRALAMVVAWSALAGAGLQVLVLLPAARALLGGLTPHLDTRNPNLREAARRLPGVILGRGVIQLSGLVDAALVSFLGDGAWATFQYAQTIYLLPMSLLGTGEAAASLPDMASDTADEDRERRHASIRARLGASLSRVLVLTVPTTLVLTLLGGEVIRVLLQNGKFDATATEHVRRVVFAYAFALLGNASARVLTNTSYAIGDTTTPARYAVYRVVVSTAGSLVLMRFFDVVGVVLGAVLAAWVETFALGWKLRQQIGGLGLEQVPFLRTAALGAVSIAPALALKAALPIDFEQGFVGSALVLAVFCAAFAVAAPALGVFDVRSLLRRRR
jgi:putative peptidoglycan lipid II flippase